MTAVVKDQTPPMLQRPSDKEKKYDRQLRLWAATGQAALEDAHILLVNSGSGTVGIETLKNLVLPGIGRFTIADDAIVNEADLGVNFFLDEQCLGKRRSQCCAELLKELNPDVQGTFIALEDLLRNDTQYTFIVYTHPVDKNVLAAIEEYSQRQKIPLISIHSAGFYSYFNIVLPGTFPIVDTHPDSTTTTDLRLLSPWPELSAFSQEMTMNINSLDSHAHGHIPYVVLLLYYLEEWRKTHVGESPRTYVEKTSFRKMVADAARFDNPEGGEENYDEAVAAVVKTVVMPSLSSSVQEVFDYHPDKTEAESSFWIITSAVKQFYTRHKALPLPGSVPDMKAQSEVYVQLQNIYKAKARRDAAEVRRYVEAHPRGKEIDIQEIETYCKNAPFIKLIRSTQSRPENLKSLVDAELNVEFPISPTLIPIFLALKASENVTTFEQGKILTEVTNIMGTEIVDERIVQTAQEVARAKAGELHNIAALTGGMVAQEIIKVMTKQYIPIDNTCVFDGITSRTQVLKI